MPISSLAERSFFAKLLQVDTSDTFDSLDVPSNPARGTADRTPVSCWLASGAKLVLNLRSLDQVE